jgi:diaminohydroxyphosphoribosylaminopyrimidine deaminase/5-amino-6-(5-phosphoribosylamino)uracil reductase
MAEGGSERFMRRAIALSQRGFPAPNPRVGCVIVRNGTIVGEGWHEYAGGPHAEMRALEQAGELAREADVYVTLEPCGHFGKTPPCADSLAAAGVARVFAACEDPNPKAAGGVRRLHEAQIECETGLLKGLAARGNWAWLAAMRSGRPCVAVKAAISLDGRIATLGGESRWITGPRARTAGRRLRAEYGAVLVGRGTVSTDNPRLTARFRGVRREPVRIVLDPEAKLTGGELVFGAPGETLWFVGEGQAIDSRQCELPMARGGFDLGALMELLWKRGVTGLMVEGGAGTISRFLKEDLVDEVHLFVSPKVFGAGLAWGGEAPLSLPSDPSRFRFVAARRLGGDLWLRLRRADWDPA